MGLRSKITLLTGVQHKDMQVAAVAGGSDGEEIVFKNSSGAPMKMTAVEFVAAAAVTGNDTNNFTLSIENKTQSRQVASKEYATGEDIAQWAADALTLSSTAANLVVEDGDVLTVKKVEAGTGLALPEGLVSFEFEYTAD